VAFEPWNPDNVFLTGLCSLDSRLFTPPFGYPPKRPDSGGRRFRRQVSRPPNGPLAKLQTGSHATATRRGSCRANHCF
jgi:hypothetical protein